MLKICCLGVVLILAGCATTGSNQVYTTHTRYVSTHSTHHHGQIDTTIQSEEDVGF